MTSCICPPAGSAVPSYMSSQPAHWLTIRRFKSAQEAVLAAQQEHTALWVADTSQTAKKLRK